MAAIDTLRRLYPEAYLGYMRYADRLQFSPSLRDAAGTTLLRSIKCGDGGLWSDSLLVHCLSSKKGSIRALFDRFPGYRTSLLAKTEFASTLSTDQFSIMP
jgi:hypothetical protein